MGWLDKIYTATKEAQEATDYAFALGKKTVVEHDLRMAKRHLRAALKAISRVKEEEDKAALQKWNEASDG